MDLLIPDSWLREFLKTKASPKQIAEYLSLCGPSIEKVQETKYGPIYSIEVTTNRVDSASVYGIAREAAAILPRFKIRAFLQSIKVANLKFSKSVPYLKAKVNHQLCPRFTAVLIKKVKIADSPLWMKERLLSVGVRPINNVVDISNYIMHEIGQPVHTFDYDKIRGSSMVLRESKRSELIKTLDGKTHHLAGGDIIIEDGDKRLIDLAGIMGAENSAVDAKTKNVLLFVQTYNPVNVRRTSMSLAQRTEAAVLFEKGLDTELVTVGIARGIELFESLTAGKPEKRILDIYPGPFKAEVVTVGYEFLTERLGIKLPKAETSKILLSLGFEVVWRGKTLDVWIPSFRATDINLPEDIAEEVARIYGYHRFPSSLMTGLIPDPLPDAPFDFEQKVKKTLVGWGGVEVYTLSLVGKQSGDGRALRLKNPLGAESEFLRTSLLLSLAKAAKENKRQKEPLHLFEMANIYLPKKGGLPEEKMILAGIFANTNFREAKGIIEALFEEIKIKAEFEIEEGKGFLPSRRVSIKTGLKHLGEFGVLEETNDLYYEFDVESLRQLSKLFTNYEPVPKYPAQIEDLTLRFPERTKIGEVIKFVSGISNLVSKIELTDIYRDASTFRLWYQHPTKTLDDSEVKKIRNGILRKVKEKFGGIIS